MDEHTIAPGEEGSARSGEEGSKGSGEVAATGIRGLDQVLRSGFPRGHLFLIEGSPGSGKTTLGLQFLLEGVRSGESGLLISFSETREDLEEAARSHGWSLDGIEIVEATGTRGYEEPEREHYTLFHPGDVELDETMDQILERIKRSTPDRIVLDPVSSLRLMARDPLLYRRQMLALRNSLPRGSETVLLLDDSHWISPGVQGGLDADLQLRSRVHGVLVLEQTPRSYGPDARRLRVVKVRGVDFQDGYHDLELRTGGLTVYPRLELRNRPEGVAPRLLPSGIPELDELLGGGLAGASTTLLMGPAGTGKTTLASVFLQAAAKRNEVSAMFSFDEDEAPFLSRLGGQGLPLSAQRDAGRFLFQKVELGRWSAGQLSHAISRAVERRGATVVLIDSLNAYLSLLAEPEDARLHLRELFDHLQRRGVLILMTMSQSGVVGDHGAAPVDMTYLADTVLLLRFFEAAGSVRKAISVVKQRPHGHERTIRELRLTSAGIEVGEPLRGFQGVLTGIPTFTGRSGDLLGDPPLREE